MEKQYDVIVVGGGVIGGAIAYSLARRKKKVLLLEQATIGSGSSSAAAGMLGAQSEMEEMGPLFSLAVRSRAMFPRLAEELREISGIDIGLVMRGLLKIAVTEEQANRYQRAISLQQSAGQTAAWLSAAEAREMEPQLTEQTLGAMYIPQDGQVVAPQLTLAFVQAAVRLGAEVREHTEVISLVIEQGRIAGVITRDGLIAADQLVLAAGVWSNTLLAQAGWQIDLYPVKGECFSVTGDGVKLGATIFTEGCYLVPKPGGRILVGATMIRRSYDRTVSVAGVSELLSQAVKLVPNLTTMRWETSWAGLRPQTPDGLPLMGEVPGCAGLFVAAGHYRNGILLSPITGEIMADQLEKKSSSADDQPAGEQPIDLRAFQLGRFR